MSVLKLAAFGAYVLDSLERNETSSEALEEIMQMADSMSLVVAGSHKFEINRDAAGDCYSLHHEFIKSWVGSPKALVLQYQPTGTGSSDCVNFTFSLNYGIDESGVSVFLSGKQFRL